MKRTTRLRIGLKHCDGCNPGYDRVALAKQIEKSLQGKVKFVSPESQDVALILAVEGCSTACADLSTFQGLEVQIITNIEGAETFIEEIRKRV